jgi:DNA-binding NtrC family response regulator
LEVGKAVRTHGINGHGYPQAVSHPSYINLAEEERSRHNRGQEEAVAGGAAAERAAEHDGRTAAIAGAWIAADPASARLIQEARSIARTSSAVLVRGESGTGKDLLAWILHALGPRASRPLLRIDCASLPPELVESELFGQEQGVFSSTTQPASLDLAGGGTLVLDEVAALSIPAQAKLLRLIEDRRFDSGRGRGPAAGTDSSNPATHDMRIVALTSASLDQAVVRRAFREDLYYRLNVIPMVVPPLRERPADIAPLATAFLNRFAEMNRRPRLQLDAMALAALEAYSFPGNVRELRNLVERAAHNTTGTEIHLADLPSQVRDSFSGAARNKMSLEDLERGYIAEVLEHTRGKKTMAAKILGISRKTLLEKRKRYSLD